MVSPCIAALRALAKDLSSMLGNYRSTHHSEPEKLLGIQKVMDSLKKYNVYGIESGRTFDDKDEPVQDIESIGMEKLLFGNSPALEEYNREFKRKQKIYRGPSISKTCPHTSLPRDPSSAADVSTSESEGQRESSRDVSDTFLDGTQDLQDDIAALEFQAEDEEEEYTQDQAEGDTREYPEMLSRETEEDVNLGDTMGELQEDWELFDWQDEGKST